MCPQPKYLTKKTQAGSVEGMRLLDELLRQLVVSLKEPWRCIMHVFMQSNAPYNLHQGSWVGS